jgi:uncharacterized Zn finger protein
MERMCIVCGDITQQTIISTSEVISKWGTYAYFLLRCAECDTVTSDFKKEVKNENVQILDG